MFFEFFHVPNRVLFLIIVVAMFILNSLISQMNYLITRPILRELFVLEN